MKRFTTLLSLLIVLLAFQIPAQAWSARGHMTVAAIAYQHLNDAEKQRVNAILRSHEKFSEWRDLFEELQPNLLKLHQ